MSKVKMVASQKFVYGGRRLSTGDTFEADHERDSRALELARRAVRAVPTTSPEPSAPLASDHPSVSRRSRYRTREMIAGAPASDPLTNSTEQ